MVALVLIAAMFLLIPFSEDNQSRKALKESTDKISRAIRFSTNESILRNVIIRIKFNLNTTPIEYIVEYGNNATLALPEIKDLSRLSIKEREIAEEKAKKFDGQFTPVDEFADSAQALPDNVSIYAIATTYSEQLISEGEVSLYFYPTGEKDSSLIFLITEIEIQTLEISPFEDRIIESIHTFEEQELVNIESTLQSMTEELYNQWLKE